VAGWTSRSDSDRVVRRQLVDAEGDNRSGDTKSRKEKQGGAGSPQGGIVALDERLVALERLGPRLEPPLQDHHLLRLPPCLRLVPKRKPRLQRPRIQFIFSPMRIQLCRRGPALLRKSAVKDDAFDVLELVDQGGAFLVERDGGDMVAARDVAADEVRVSDVDHGPVLVDPARLDPMGHRSRLGKAVETHRYVDSRSARLLRLLELRLDVICLAPSLGLLLYTWMGARSYTYGDSAH